MKPTPIRYVIVVERDDPSHESSSEVFFLAWGYTISPDCSRAMWSPCREQMRSLCDEMNRKGRFPGHTLHLCTLTIQLTNE